MKCPALTIALLFITMISYGQNYLDKIADDACACINDIPDTLNGDKMTFDLGLCMINAAEPYSKQLKKEFGLEINSPDFSQGKELGGILAIRLAARCPEKLKRVVNKVNQNRKDKTKVESEIIEGQLTGIDGNIFLEFSLKDETGKVSKFYWLSFIKSDMELTTEYNSLLEKYVRITYRSEEFFDARIGEYRMFNIIQEFEVIEE